MSLNLILIQLVLFTSIFMLAQANRLPRGWLVVTGILFTTLAIGFLTVPDVAGYISGGLWIVLYFVPLLGFGRVNRLVSQERYQTARRLASWLKWLHPADGYMEYPQLLRGLELGQQGKLEEAKQLISRYQTNTTSTGRMSTVMIYRMGAQWEELVRWVEDQVPDKVLYKEVGLAAAYLRSLGELGDLNGLIQGAERFERRMGRGNNSLLLNTVRLYVFAFCGQVESVKYLFKGALAVYPLPVRQFWLGTAELIGGREAVGREMLMELRNTIDHSLQQAIDRRLAAPHFDPLLGLTEPSRQSLLEFRTGLIQDSRYNGWVALTTRKSYATYSLIGINLVVFGFTMLLGSSEDLETLYRMGALVPEAVFAGEWWRSLTAIFLHAGLLHISANMLGLYIFGTLVESALGYRKFLVSYFFCGIGSMLTVAMISVLAQSDPQITVGASGAVLGLVGTEAAIQLKGWRLEKAKIARERLRFIALVVVFQFISDLVTPQVSLIGHLSGLILGFGAGLILFKIDDKYQDGA